jgi:hypothetical protein
MVLADVTTIVTGFITNAGANFTTILPVVLGFTAVVIGLRLGLRWVFGAAKSV